MPDDDQLQEYVVRGRRALLHPSCIEGFRADREAGLIYGPYYLSSEGRFAQTAEEASVVAKFCPYCGRGE